MNVGYAIKYLINHRVHESISLKINIPALLLLNVKLCISTFLMWELVASSELT